VHGTADADGRYLLRFARKPDAGLRVAASATGYLPTYAAAREPTQRLGTLAFAMDPLVLTLCGSADGRVVDESGTGVADAEVQVRALLDPEAFTPWNDDTLHGATALGVAIDPPATDTAHAVARFRTRTDSKGAFQVTVPLRAETVHFVVRARDREPSVSTVDTSLLGRGSVIEDARVLRVAASQAVRLRFEQNGLPLSRARVLFQDLRLHPVHQLNTPWLETGEDGTLDTALIAAGRRYNLLVNTGRAHERIEDVEIDDSGVIRVP
jgi:hypothetical protein